MSELARKRWQLLGEVSVHHFYTRKQLLLSAHLSHRNSVHLSIYASVCQTGGSVKNDASYDHQIFTNRKAFS